MIIAVNIGWKHKSLGGRVLSTHPLLYHAKTFRQFSDELRDPELINNLIETADKKIVSRSFLCLHVSVLNSARTHDHTVMMKNVREYAKAMKESIRSF